jgi:putative transposase
MKSHLKTTTGKDYSKAIQALYSKRNRVYKDFYHKSSKYIVDFCLEQGINYLVVGNNKGWKYKAKLSKQVNQTFSQIGYSTFISMLKYKCKEAGIDFKVKPESYTSGTSFLDNEAPTAEKYEISRRKPRGLFKHNNPNFKTQYINSDINAAYQILSKATNNKLYYISELFTQSSIEPTIINIDTFNRKTHKPAQQRSKYTLKVI